MCEEWHKKYGSKVVVDIKDLLSVMNEISYWVNNEIGEECMFDVE